MGSEPNPARRDEGSSNNPRDGTFLRPNPLDCER
jgi:hypothetical protein